MAKPAARVDDPHECPDWTFFVIPHIGGPINPPCAPNMKINGKPAARSGDKASCLTATDTIVMGSATVYWDGAPAARVDDLCRHTGKITGGSPNVLIGGAGVIGNPVRAAQFFPGRQQSKDSCALMSTQGIVHQATGVSNTEAEMKTIGANSGAYVDCNGTTNEAQVMTEAGVPATQHAQPTLNDIRDALRDGKAVIVGLDARAIWGSNDPNPLGHAIRVTGVETDANGNVTAVYINDTGTGNSNQRVPADVFQQSMDGWGGSHRMATSNDPVP